ncbi:MAG: hypothetical protein K6F50_06700 [Kiritimatiellae bacterium]|nr:hypothetical protein [Kiritimatiellia bacterium]
MNRRPSIAFGFLALIVLGAIFLASPWARTDSGGAWGAWGASLFTSFSAVCVTGLTVVDIGTTYTLCGQIILLVLVEIGCLGLMTCGTFLLIAVGRRLSLSREFSLMNAYGVAQVKGLKGLICWVVGSMLFIEALGALAIYFCIGDVYSSIFYSVMGFCNAGFGLETDSLASFRANYAFVLVMAALTILGGTGFLVLYNICTYRFLNRSSGARGRLSLHSRVVLRFTAWLLAVSFALFLLAEWNGAMKGLSFAEKLTTGFYQAVTPRTCGFCIIPTENLSPLTRFTYAFLMFIGGGPGSASAGIKITTFAVLIYTCVAMCRGENETAIDRRVVPADIVRESIVILMALIAFVAIVIAALLVTESPALSSGKVKVEALFFEAVSAITTTGLSVGSTTRDLSAGGKAIIMAAMFIGRLGALTVVLMIGDRESTRHVRFPSEEIVVG